MTILCKIVITFELVELNKSSRKVFIRKTRLTEEYIYLKKFQRTVQTFKKVPKM